MPIPKFDDLFNPLLKALHNLGGSASILELEDEVAKILNLSDADVDEIYKGSTKFSYKLAWARSYLKRYGVIDNSIRGVWGLTSEGKKCHSIDKDVVKKKVKTLSREAGSHINKKKGNISIPELSEQVWKRKLLETVKTMPSDAFERLCQRLLRESGFIQVEITGRPNDRGIDGKGIMRISGLISFHVIFQCKRYQGSVLRHLLESFEERWTDGLPKGYLLQPVLLRRMPVWKPNVMG